MQYLKQSTAATVLVGPVLDADGAAVTGAVIGDFRLAKNGTVSTMSGNTISHSHNGCYLITLTTANTDTLDRLSISVGNTSYSMTVFRYTVLTSGMFDALITNGRILRSTNSNSEILVTSSNHAAADVHALQANVIDAAAIAASAVTEIQSGLATAAQATAIETDTQDLQTRLPAALVGGRMDASVGAMAANTLTASALAADAVTEIQVGLATSTEVTAAFTEIKGATWSSATDTLEAIRNASGGGGGTSIMVTPVVAQVPVRVRDTDIETYIGDLSTIRIGIFSGEDAVDLSGFGDLEVCVQAKDGTDLDFVEMADLTIDGDDNNYVSWDPAGPSVATIRRGKWSLRKSSNKQVIAKGAWIISDAALEDTGS